MKTASPAVRLLLDVWREVSRHLEIDASAEALAQRIGEVVPLARLLIRRWDEATRRLDTVAAAGPLPIDAQTPHRTVLTDREAERLGTWLRTGQARLWRGGEGNGIRALLDPTGFGGHLVAGPCLDGGRPVGVVVLQGKSDLMPHVPLVQGLLEPLTVALTNDRRVHELARLREAAEADNRALLSRLERQDISDSIVGAGTGLKEVLERVDQVAPTDAPVLILGETGSGKEVVARAIHNRSRRAQGPFLRVNCGAIPSELVDSELFGHEKGSFTGAVATRRGWFERADGGTLFLDELGELPPAAQVRLLRVLQDGSFERVGGQHGLVADVRIVAATHRDMRELVMEGRFREDLWYRVSVFPLALPPLRDRRQDIPALATHFAARAGLRLHGLALSPDKEELRLLTAYEWPGNVRELAAVIERAAILGDGRRLEVGRALGVQGLAPVNAVAVGGLEGVNRQAITEALRRTRGRIEGPTGTAKLLGLQPSTLRSRMKKLGIDWRAFRQAGR